MKRICKKAAGVFLCVILAAGCLAAFLPVPARAAEKWPSGPAVESPNVIVMEASTGTVLFEKKADQKRYPASITKILTTLLAIENSTMDEVVTFSADAVYKNEGDTSHISRDVDEQLTMEQCLYAVMLESANECAYAVAEHVGGGDYSSFIKMMNDRAKALGCTRTHFANSNGLPDKKHYTTCRDMALIASAAINNPTFRKIAGTKQYIIPKTNKHKEKTPLNNHHQMISTYKGAGNLYEYCIGGKTGYTVAAKNTLVSFAEKDGMTLVCVVMYATGTQYSDTRNLFDYCFDHFQMTNVAQNETRYDTGKMQDENSLFAGGEAFAALDAGAGIVLPKSAKFEDTTVELSYDRVAPDILGTLVYSYGDRRVGMADVKTTGVTAKPYEFGENGGAGAAGTESGREDAEIGEKEPGNSGADSEGDTAAGTETGQGEEKPQKADNPVKQILQNLGMKKIITILVVVGAAIAALLVIWYLYNNLYRIWRRKKRRDRRYKTIKNNRKWNRRGGRR